jgi:protoporphyrinogen oxidase
VHAARAFLAGVLPASPLTEWLETIELRPTFTLAAALDATADRSAFGILRHRGESRSVSACAVHGAKLGAHAPSGTDAVIAWPTPAAAAELHSRPAAEIVAALMPEVEELVPVVRGHVTHVRLYRAEAGTPLVRPGYAAHRAAGRALAAELPLPIALAGDYLTTPTIEGAVASGEAAAAVLAARLASTGA